MAKYEINYRGKNYLIGSDGRVSLDNLSYEVIKSSDALHSKNNEYNKYFFDYEIKLSDFEDNSVFDLCIFNKSAELNNCKITNAIFCEDSIIDNVEFITTEFDYQGVVFDKKVEFNSNSITEEITRSLMPVTKYDVPVSSNPEDAKPYALFTFKSIASFENRKDSNISLFLKDSNNGSLIFKRCHFKRLKIRNVEDGDYENQQQKKAKLKELHIIDCTADEGAYLRIGYVDVADFKLQNLRNPLNAELNIGDCHFKNFEITNFRNSGKFKLYKINVLKNETKNNQVFNINNTSIGDTDFQSLNLTSFATVKMFDNILSGINYTNVKWKENIGVGQYGSYKTKIAKKRDTYRTLKNVAQKNNDQPEVLKFYAKEMSYHQKIVSGNKKYSLSDRITLWFNKCTNNFGLSFWQPILILFGIALLFYFLLLVFLQLDCCFKFTPLQESYSNIFGQFFEFLNPTHKIKFIGGYSWGIAAYIVDFFFRIFEGLLIYQTIQAFRKYSRKL